MTSFRSREALSPKNFLNMPNIKGIYLNITISHTIIFAQAKPLAKVIIKGGKIKGEGNKTKNKSR